MKLSLQSTPLKKISLLALASAALLFSQCKKDTLVNPETSGVKMSGNAETQLATASNTAVSTVPLKNMFGANGYEWNFLQNPADHNDVSKIFEPKMALIKTFSSIRHYLDWSKIEYTQGNYTFNPSHDGSWNLDAIYERCKAEGIFMLADIKDCPSWLQHTYPSVQQNVKTDPMLFGSDPSLPASYTMQAKAAFQFAARYGSNVSVLKQFVKVANFSRWTNDPVNEVKIGLNLVKYMECDNERDNWWIGTFGEQTADEYAADMSAFYDGDQSRLGKNVGVKNADPNMKVVIGGLATANVAYIKEMVNWCRIHRGLKADGSVNLCFDVINYHWYSNDGNVLTNVVAKRGVAPELNPGGAVADGFVKYAASLPQHPEVWITEAGYDINPKSTQRAFAIGTKSALVTQADWTVRTSLMYMRHGISRLFFYQLFDDLANGPITFQTAGLLNDDLTRRPVANYIQQVGTLMGSYYYAGTLNSNPFVDKYLSGSKTIYSLVVPDQKGRTASYTLDLGTSQYAYVYNLDPASTEIIKTKVATNNGQLTLTVTETPMFVQPI